MYRVVPVPRALAGTVTRTAVYDEHSPVPLRRREIPRGSCTLILGWDPPPVSGTATAPAFLAGLRSDAVRTVFRGRQRGVQVDLSPLGIVRLLGNGRDWAGSAVPVSDLGVPALAGLPDRLADEPTWAARMARVHEHLTAALEVSTRRPDPEVARAWRRLREGPGRVPVAALATEVGWSRRHLLARFRDQIGLSPTTAGRVLRVERAALLLVPGSGPDRRPSGERVAEVAAAAGFSDHSHLVREFRALAGCTPGRYVAERGGTVFPDVQDGESDLHLGSSAPGHEEEP